MINSFSEKHGMVKSVSLNLDEMPTGLRNRLWNITKKHIDDLSIAMRLLNICGIDFLVRILIT